MVVVSFCVRYLSDIPGGKKRIHHQTTNRIILTIYEYASCSIISELYFITHAFTVSIQGTERPMIYLFL